MAALTKHQLDELQCLLAHREAALRTHLRQEHESKIDYVQVASEAPDPGDAAFATLSMDLGNAAVGRDLAELRAIEAARRRMRRDAYGECVQCGYDIPFERLLAQPVASRCAPCQNMYERTHADTGSRN